MKLYLFDPENGVYEGETFDERGTINQEEGITSVAPPNHHPGEVPVFDLQRQVWEVIPLAVARQLIQLPKRIAKGEFP